MSIGGLIHSPLGVFVLIMMITAVTVEHLLIIIGVLSLLVMVGLIEDVLNGRCHHMADKIISVNVMALPTVLIVEVVVV